MMQEWKTLKNQGSMPNPVEVGWLLQLLEFSILAVIALVGSVLLPPSPQKQAVSIRYRRRISPRKPLTRALLDRSNSKSFSVAERFIFAPAC